MLTGYHRCFVRFANQPILYPIKAMKHQVQPRQFSQQVMTTMRTRLRLPVTLLMLVSTLTWSVQSHALVLIKTNSGSTTLLAIPTAAGNTTNAQNAVPTAADTMLFNNLITGASTYRLSNIANSNLALNGIRLANPGGAITLQNSDNQSQTLTLGAGGIDMSLATQNLTISNATGGTATLATSASQAWTIANGRTLTASGPIILGNQVDMRFVGGNTGGTAGIVTLSGSLSGAGSMSISGMIGGTGGTVNLSANNSAWTGAVTVSGGATLNVDTGTTGSQSRLADAQILTLNRSTLTLTNNASNQVETVGGLTLGQGLSQVLRTSTNNAVKLNVNGAITLGTGAALNVGNIGTTAGNSHLLTDQLNTNGIMGTWAVAINGTTGTDWVKNATNAADGAVIAASGADYTTNNAPATWNTATQNILMTASGSAVAGASKTINSLKIAHGTANTPVTLDIGNTFTLTINDGQNGGGIIRNQPAATTIGNANVGQGTITAGAADATADTLRLWNSQSTMTVNNLIANNGAGSLHLFSGGAGTVVLTALNTYTGGTTIAAGTLTLGNNSSTGGQDGDVATLGTGAVSNFGTLTINKRATVAGVNATIANSISGPGTLNLNRGVLTFSGTNTYSGDTNLLDTSGAATFRVGSAGALSASSRMVLNAASVILDMNGFSGSVAALRGDQASANVALGAGTLTLSGSDDARSGTNDVLLSRSTQVYQGIISGSGGLVKSGDYVQQLNGSGALSFTGSTTVNAGTLQVSKAIATNALNMNGGTFIADTGAVLTNVTTLTLNGGSTFTANATAPLPAVTSLTVNAGGSFLANQPNLLLDTAAVSLGGIGATWQMANGTGDTIASLTSVQNSRLTLGAGAGSTTLTVNDNSGLQRTLGGVITMSAATSAGQGSVVKNGNATWVLGGGNGYNGNTTINGGIVRVDGGAVVQVLPDFTAVTLANTAGVALDLNGRDETIGSLGGGGTLGGNVILGSGTLTVGRNGADSSFGAVISGSGGLIKTGSGVLTLTGVNTFTGAVSLNGGVLNLANPGGNALANGVSVQIAGGTLALTNSETIGHLSSTRNSTINLGAGTVLTSNHATAAGIVRVGNVDTDTRIMRVSSTAGLVPGSAVSGTGVAAGTYVVQVLNQNQVLVNRAVTVTASDENYTFIPATQMAASLAGAGQWTKTGAGTVVLSGASTLAGTIGINQGAVQVGGVSHGGRNIFQDVLGDGSTIAFGSSGALALNFADNVVNLLPFERVGAISGGAGAAAVVNLSGGASNTVLAVGGNNSTTTFTGEIRGAAGAWLIKEGTGTMTWSNTATDTLNGVLRINQGGFTIAGAAGLDQDSNAVVSNLAGATLTVDTSGGDSISFLTGGGRGSTRTFPNGVQGALLGNYLGGTGGQVVNNTGLTLTNNTTNAVFTFAGAMSGAGGLTKQGGSILELRGVNTYSGNTLIEGTTDSTTNTLRIGVFGSSAGVGTGTAGFGLLSPNSTLQINAGTGGTARNVLFDLNGSTQTVNTLTSANAVGIKTMNLNGGTLTINTISGASSGSYDGSINGRGTINVTATTGVSGWEIQSNNNNTQTGNVNVTGGRLTLRNLVSSGVLGDSVHVTVNGAGTLAVATTDRVGSLSGSGALVLSQGLQLGSGPQGSVMTNPWSGTSSGGGGLTLLSGGSVRITANQGYSGSTTLNDSSVLFLDYSGAGVNNIITSSLVLNGGSILLRGNSTAETVTFTQLNGGAAYISAQSGDTSRINLASITRAEGGVLQVKGTSAHTTSTGADMALGILGGYATWGNGGYLTTWAVQSSSLGGSVITGLPDASYSALWGAGLNTDITTSPAQPVEGNTGSLRFNTADPSSGLIELVLGGVTGDVETIIESGGILVTRNVGSTDIYISEGGGAVLKGGLDGTTFGMDDEIVIHQNNPLGTLYINANISEQARDLSGIGNGPNSVGNLTKVGPGRVVLARNNNYSGRTRILGGVLQLGDGGFFGNLGRNITDPVTNFGYLSVNRADDTLDIGLDIIGTGSIRLENGGVQLAGSNSTYTGTTYVLGGILTASGSSAIGGGLGSVNGLTTVSSGARLNLSSVNSSEPIVLKGGTLGGRGSNPGVAGPLVLTENSTLNAISLFSITGSLVAHPGAALTVTGPNTLLLNTTNTQVSSTIVASGGTLQLGNNSAGFIGRGSILLQDTGRLITSLNDGQYTLGAIISGDGSYTQLRNTVSLTANNSFTGGTTVGGNIGAGSGGNIGLADQNAELRIGNDTYTGSLGTGDVTVQSSTGGNSTLRYMHLGDVVVPNTITLNPWTDAAATSRTARNAILVRQSLGNLTLTGEIIAGSHVDGPTGGSPIGAPNTQRAVLQTEGGGKTIFAGTLTNSPDSRLNIINNGIFEIAGSVSNTYEGVLSNNGVWVFNNTGTTTLNSINTVNTGNFYIQRGTLVINEPGLPGDPLAQPTPIPATPSDGLQNDNDQYLLRGATLQFNFTETIGQIYTQKNSTLVLPTGGTVITDDGGAQYFNGNITGDGTIQFGNNGLATATFLTGDASTYTGVTRVAQGTLQLRSVANNGLASSLGSGNKIELGKDAGTGVIEYIGTGHSTDRDIVLSVFGGGVATFTAGGGRISANGAGPLVLNGNITTDSSAAATAQITGPRRLSLSGYSTMGNTLNGAILQTALGPEIDLIVAEVGSSSQTLGTGKWKLTNTSSNFTGSLTVGIGTLEVAGNLGDGTGVTSILGNLNVPRFFNLGQSGFDGFRGDIFGAGDNFGGATTTGSLIFNDPNVGTATFGSHISFNLGNTSNTNPGNGAIVNNGTKVVVINGALTKTTGNSNSTWFLDGTNTGANTINGTITDSDAGGTVSLTKNGSGIWRVMNTVNTFSGTVTVNRGTLEMAGGNSINNGALVNLANAGSDGSAAEAATLRLLSAEAVGGLSGAIGTSLILDGTLTLTGATQTFSGVISGAGGFTRSSNDGTARIQTLTNINTYTGGTSIITGSGAAGNRIDAYYLANGGVNSSIGASSNAAANLVIDTITANGGLRFLGYTSQTTDRLMTLGANAATTTTSAPAAIWADGTTVTGAAVVPSITFSNTGPVAFTTPNLASTLMLRGQNLGNNTFNPQLTDNGTGVVNVTKIERSVWVLGGANSFSGAVNILAGVGSDSNNAVTGGTLIAAHDTALGTAAGGVNIGLFPNSANTGGGAGTGLMLRGGVTITGEALAANIADASLTADSGVNLWTGGVSMNVTNVNFRLAASPGATLNISGVIAGALGTGRLQIVDNGTRVLSGANTYTGITTLSGGTVRLDYSTSNTSKLHDGSALELGGAGIITLLGADADVHSQLYQAAFGGTILELAGGSHSEIVSGLTLNNGASRIQRAVGSTATIQLGAITRPVGGGVSDYGTLDFAPGVAFSSNAGVGAALNNILGGFATLDKTDWAVATTITTANVVWTDATDRITLAGLTNGSQIRFTGTAPAGLTAGTNYFIVNATATDFQVSTTSGGNVLPLTNSGTTATAVQPNTVSAVAASAYNNNTSATLFGAGFNTDVLVSLEQGAVNTQSLRFNQAADITLTLTGLLSLETEGILMTPNSGPVIITGGGLRRSATTANLDLAFHTHSASPLTVASVIQNNSGALGLTKTGSGTLILAAANTQTGRVSVQQGVLQVGDGTPDTTAAVVGATNLAFSISHGAELRINVANAAAVYDTGVITGGGTLRLASTNTSTLLLNDDMGNWIGDTIIDGGTLRVAGSNAASVMGNLRGTTTVNNGGTLQLFGALTATTGTITPMQEWVVFNQGSTLAAIANGTTNTLVTMSGNMALNNTSPGGFVVNLAPSQSVTLSGLVEGSSGFTKTGNGILTLSGSNYTGVLVGQTAISGAPSLSGQILVNQGELRIGNNPRALGATGIGHETIIASGATFDLNGQSLNFGDDPNPLREIIHIAGTGLSGTGALRNSTGTAIATHLVLTADATVGSGGTNNGATLRMDPFDINQNTGSGLNGNATLVSPTITSSGGNFNLTKVGVGDFDLRDATLTNINSILIREGRFRWLRNTPPNIGTGALTAGDVGSIEIGYGGATLGDLTNTGLGLSASTGARLDLFRNVDTHHTTPITMNGVLAGTSNGYNYLEVNGDTLPIRTYLNGALTLSGTANRNLILVEANGGTNTVIEQGNTTGQVQGKLIINGQITGTGGFSKIGYRELRLTNNNNFTGDLNVLRFGSQSAVSQSSPVAVNGVNIPTYGEGESWGEWGLTLLGPNGRISGAANINLQRRGMITLDNTSRLDPSTGIAGGIQGDRISDSSNILFRHGWLRIHGGSGPVTESLATSGGAKVQVLSGTNILDLWPEDGANQNLTLTIGEITQSPGAVLRITNLDATSTFNTTAGAGVDSVRVRLNSLGTLQESGAATTSTSRKIVLGILGGTIPDIYLDAQRVLSGGVSDLYNQGRNLQFITGSHFVTYDGGFLRPLDDSEYFIPGTGLIDTTGGAAGQNVAVTDAFTIVRENVSINSLRFGPVADYNGSGGTINNGTTLTSYTGGHNIQLHVDGTLSVTSGMLSSAYYTVGNTSSLGTFIIGGTVNFGNREGIINNQNGLVGLSDGVTTTGDMGIRSNLQGTAGIHKTGIGQVILDGMNTFTGPLTVSEGTLLLRNGRFSAGAGGGGIVVTGNGALVTGNGIQVGSAAGPEDIYVGVLQGNRTILQVTNDLTNYYGDIIVDNVDAAGMPLFTPALIVDGNASLILNGDIYGGSTPISQDTAQNDSRFLTTNGSGAGYLILRGQVGDRGIAGSAAPIQDPVSAYASLSGTRTNENEVFRFQITGSSDDLNVAMDQQYDAAGRLMFERGVLVLNYTPGAAGSDGSGFWTDTALSKIPGGNANSVFSTNASTSATNNNSALHGFLLGAGGTTAMFLSKPGQTFNLSSWRVSNNNSATAWIGGLNDTGVVTYGADGGNLTLEKTLRFYQMSGGSANLNMRVSNGNTLTKVGRGALTLLNTNAGTTASDTNSFELGGGTLIVDHSGQAAVVARIGPSGTSTFRGGSFVVRSNNAIATTASYSTDTGGTRTVQFTAGGTEIIAETVNTGTARDMTLQLGNSSNNSPVLRSTGATANFVENAAAGGAARINLNFSAVNTAAMKNRAISWATFGTAPRTALDFAMSDNGNGNRLGAFVRASEEFQNNAALWTRGMDVSESGGAGFFGSVVVPLTLNTLRFDALADSSVNLNSQQVMVAGDGTTGGVLVSTNTGSANKTITGGSLSAYSTNLDPVYNTTRTGTTTAASNQITNVSSTAGLAPGMVISGTGIPAGATIVALTANTITLSIAASSATVGLALNVYTFIGTTTNGSSTITGVPSTVGLSVGMPISGAGIPAGATIAAIASGTLTLSANATATSATGVALLTETPDLTFHQYGRGTLTVASTLNGNNGVIVAGPSTTNPNEFGTTGTVRFTGTNTYSGRTFLNGSVLEIADPAALGTDPAAVANNQIIMNGGTLRFTGTGTTTLGNRGITLEGNGGVIEVVNPDANLMLGTGVSGAQAALVSQELFRGDLIKTGAGTLTFQGSGTGHNSGFQGLLDIRQGTLSVMVDVGDAAVGTTSILGSNRTWADGTIFRTGTNFHAFLGNGNNNGDWNIDEFITFEGNNTFTYSGILDVNANLAAGGTLDGIINLGNRRTLNFNGVINVAGATTLNIGPASNVRLNNGVGYLTGSGDIIKDGQGQLEFRANVPDWTGGLVIKQGTVYAISQADMLGTGYATGKRITLGDAQRQGTAQLLIQNPDSLQNWIFEVEHDIDVIYNPAQTKRLGIDNVANGNRISYNGDITLNDNLIVTLRDVSASAAGEQSYLNFNGSILDGATTSGNITFQSEDSDGTANNINGSRLYSYAVLNGNNSAWTGDVILGTNTSFNSDNTTILRLGHAQALTAANDVTMNFNTILQAGGQDVTIGSLITQGGTGAFFGDAGTASGTTNGGSEIIENAAATAAALTIAQSTPLAYEALWDAKFRDGTLNSQFFAPGTNVQSPSAALSLVKAGSGWATLTLDNDYSGTTTVAAGTLQVGRNGFGDTGSATALGATVNSAATIAGTGIINGGLTVLSGGFTAPGDSGGAAMGTLTVNGAAIFAAGSTALLQVRTPTYNNPGALDIADPLYATWKNGVSSDSFSNALDDLVTPAQHDMVNVLGTINWTPGTKVTLINDGYTPKAGDIFHIVKADTYNGGINRGADIRIGNEIGTDLTLFQLGGNFRWDVSKLNSDGIVIVVSSEDAAFIPPPPPTISSGPNRVPATGILEPGTSVTVSATVTGTGPITLQWYRNEVAVPGATNLNYTFQATSETKGTYKIGASNAGGSVLSGGVLIDVNDQPFITAAGQPTSRTVNPSQSTTFTVTASGPAPFSYQWRKNNVDIPLATAASYTIPVAAQEDEGTYSVVVTNAGGSITSLGATLTVRDPVANVVATRSPSATNTYLGDVITFSVTAQGTAPLSYQWQRKIGAGSFENAPNGTNATLLVTNTALGDSEYRVIVNNVIGTPVTSDSVPLRVLQSLPEITAEPVSQTLLSGEPLNLVIEANGKPTLKYLWKRNNAAVTGATSAVYALAAAAVANGGIYTCEVSNTSGKDTSTAVHIVVVDGGTTLMPLLLGATATLNASVGAGTTTVLGYAWFKDGVKITAADGARFTGFNTKTLKITATTLNDDAIYTCQVTAPGGMVEGCTHDLRIFDKAPIVTSAALPQGIIGGTYNYQIEVDPDHTRTPVSYAATGLPTGLRIDTKTGVISGKPTVTKVGGYAVKLTATNTRGKSEVTLNLNVLTLPTSIPGVYVGPVVRHLDADLGAGLGGRFDLTVTTTASYTGSITLGAVRHTFPAGTLDIDVNGALSPSATIVIRRTGTPTPAPLTVSFKIDKITGLITDATVTDGTDTAAFSGWKNVWNATTVQATKYLGLYTFAMALADGDPLIGSSAVPQGYSYASFTVARDGKLSLVGRTADGEGITGALVLGPNGEMLIFQTLYTTTPKGSIHGTLAINDQGTATDTDNTLGGNVTWVRPPNTTAAARTYKAGFGTSTATSGVTTPVTIAAVGGRYVAPVAPAVVLGIPGPGVNNAKLEFAEDGDTGDADDATDVGTNDNPDVILSVGALSKITLPTGAANPALTKLTVTPTTGIFSGSFSLDDPNPRTTPPVTPAAVKRAVTYQGLIVRDGAEYVGYGYFLNAQLPGNGPPATTPTTTEMRSGMVDFTKL